MSGIYESIPATPDEVEVFGESLTDAHLHCRVWGHDPDPQGNTRLCSTEEREKIPGAFWWINPPCTHGCGVRWIIVANAEGEVIRRNLDYSNAEDYLSKTGRINAQGNAILRRQFLTRATTVGGKRRQRKTGSR